MSFERFYHEIREKLGNEGQDLYNKDLLKKIHSHTLDCKWNFDKGQEISEENWSVHTHCFFYNYEYPQKGHLLILLSRLARDS